MKMDDTWNVFDIPLTGIEDFKNRWVPEIYLKPQVHKDVQEKFRVIKKLIQHSYFEYQFYDVAATESLLTFEMALKLRYKEINAKDWEKNKPLAQLIDWFEKRNYFEVYNDLYLKSIRQIRNGAAHPTQHSMSGGLNRRIIENILDLINGLYEDTTLRKDRMELSLKIIAQLNAYNEAIKCTIDGSSHYAFTAWPGFINNKLTPSEIYFYLNPAVIISEELLSRGNWFRPNVISFTGHSVEFSNSSITIKNTNGPKLIVSGITDPEEKKDFDNWADTYKSYFYPQGGYFYRDGKEVETFSFHLREFYKL
jgi:hypothetical protein